MKCLDPGHRYRLFSLDGFFPQTVQFVKRCDLANPERFPGNTNAYSGTTLQNVIRMLVDRIEYLQQQIWAPENALIHFFLKSSLWLLEFRAARRHGHSYWHGLNFATHAPMCETCGHTQCKH